MALLAGYTKGIIACHCEVDDDIFELVSKWRWKVDDNNYFWRRFKTGKITKEVKLHRFIAQPPKDVLVDHIDRNRLNNKRSNLRFATHQENSRNRISNTSKFGYKGVQQYTVRKEIRYVACLEVSGRRFSRKGHLTPESAARAYDDLAELYFGEFAKFNFPNERNIVITSLSHIKIPKITPSIPPPPPTPAQCSHIAPVQQNKYGYRGVLFTKERYYAQLKCRKITTITGPYQTAQDAARAFDRMAFDARGIGTFLNFPDENPTHHVLVKKVPKALKPKPIITKKRKIKINAQSSCKFGGRTVKPNAHNYRGVVLKKEYMKYSAQLRVRGKSYYCGHFHKPEDAARAYDRLSYEYRNASGFLNFPQEDPSQHPLKEKHVSRN